MKYKAIKLMYSMTESKEVSAETEVCAQIQAVGLLMAYDTLCIEVSFTLVFVLASFFSSIAKFLKLVFKCVPYKPVMAHLSNYKEKKKAKQKPQQCSQALNLVINGKFFQRLGSKAGFFAGKSKRHLLILSKCGLINLIYGQLFSMIYGL